MATLFSSTVFYFIFCYSANLSFISPNSIPLSITKSLTKTDLSSGTLKPVTSSNFSSVIPPSSNSWTVPKGQVQLQKRGTFFHKNISARSLVWALVDYFQKEKNSYRLCSLYPFFSNTFLILYAIRNTRYCFHYSLLLCANPRL